MRRFLAARSIAGLMLAGLTLSACGAIAKTGTQPSPSAPTRLVYAAIGASETFGIGAGIARRSARCAGGPSHGGDGLAERQRPDQRGGGAGLRGRTAAGAARAAPRWPGTRAGREHAGSRPASRLPRLRNAPMAGPTCLIPAALMPTPQAVA